MIRQDTIVAIATPAGEGGIGIIRLSGDEAVAIAARMFRGKLRDRRTVLGAVYDASTGETIDEAIGIAMLAPRSYTREDVVELQAHGGPAALRRIVEAALQQGARLAEPGEFTLRAFLSGRLDLAQAESVLDLIRARTDASLRLAVQGLGGRLSAQIRATRSDLVDVLAYLSARIDFPDEDVAAEDVRPALRAKLAALETLLSTSDAGMIYRQGARVAIVGSPNVGKSSLMNALLREDRTIVTAVAGTTRDTVEETANVCGIPIILTDTAGLGEPEDVVERIGVARSREAMARTDALLIVLDSARPLLPLERALLAETEGRPRIIVLNKLDLQPDADTVPVGIEFLRISALTGAGLPELERLLADLVTGGRVLPSDVPVVTNARHKAALLRSADCLREALASATAGLPEDFVSIDLRAAIEALGAITGESVTEDLLDSIFSHFCVGK